MKVNELQSLLRNQTVQTSQTIPFRKRFRLDYENESDTMFAVLETYKHPRFNYLLQLRHNLAIFLDSLTLTNIKLIHFKKYIFNENIYFFISLSFL